MITWDPMRSSYRQPNKFQSIHNFLTNLITPLHPLIISLHKYHIAMALYSSKYTWGFLRKTPNDPTLISFNFY